MQLGALVVGVGDYSYSEIELSDTPSKLNFAVEDARSIALYLQTCWGEENRAVIEIYDQDVSLSSIEAGFKDLSEKGAFSTLIVFLSGHGIVSSDDAGFLLQPASYPSNQLSVLQAKNLNAFIASCSAKQTILILDCCFAGAIAEQLPYFTQLGRDETARLFIASSRSDQITWEDEVIGKGIFTAHLLDLLNTGDAESLERTRSSLDVDAELFPILCEQVPLYALKHKSAKQEPLKGGLSLAPVLLPTVKATKALKSNSVLSTALQRFRQLVAVTVFSVVIFLIGAYVLTYHIEPTSRGNLAIKRGYRWLEPVFRYFPTTRVETRLSVLELSPDSHRARPLRSGYASGVWLHMNTSNYRAWADNAINGLNSSSAFQYRALIGDRPLDDEIWASREETVSNELLLRIWSLIGTDGSQLPVLLKRIPGFELHQKLDEPFSPSEYGFTTSDFAILDLTEGQMLNYITALEYAFIVDQDAAWPHFLGFVKASSEWLFFTSEGTKGRGAHDRLKSAIGKALVRLINLRYDRGLEPLDDAMMSQLLILNSSNYSDSLSIAFARSGVAGLVEIARKKAADSFLGNPFESSQGRALRLLIYSLNSSEASIAAVDNALAKFDQTDALQNTHYIRLLIEAGANGSLSRTHLSKLMSSAHASLEKAKRDFEDIEIARVLSFSMGLIPLSERETAYQLIETIASEEPPNSFFVSQMFAALAEQKLDKPYMLDRVLENVRYAKTDYHQANRASESQSGMVVLISSDPWISTLASFAMSRKLNPEDQSLLSKHLENPRLKNSISRSVVAYTSPLDTANAADQIFDALELVSSNFPERKKQENLISHALAKLSFKNFKRQTEQLLLLRLMTEEPELRASISQIIIDSTLLRTQPAAEGLPLLR